MKPERHETVQEAPSKEPASHAEASKPFPVGTPAQTDLQVGSVPTNPEAPVGQEKTASAPDAETFGEAQATVQEAPWACVPVKQDPVKPVAAVRAAQVFKVQVNECEEKAPPVAGQEIWASFATNRAVSQDTWQLVPPACPTTQSVVIPSPAGKLVVQVGRVQVG